MAHVVAVSRFPCWLLKKKRSDDGSCFEGDAFERGPFTIRHKQAAEGLSEVLPTVSLGSLKMFLRHFVIASYACSTSLMKSLASLAPHLKVGVDILLKGGSSMFAGPSFFSGAEESG